MANFDKYANYRDDAGVSSVVFGANSPVLEVELNEMQEIQKALIRSIIRSSIGNGIYGKENVTSVKSQSTLNGVAAYVTTVKIRSGSIILCNGYVIRCTDDCKCVVSKNDATVYLHVWEGEASDTTVLKKYGYSDSKVNVDNWIKDSRVNKLTTKRKVVRYKLSTNMPEDSSVSYMPIAHVAEYTSGLIDNILVDNLSDVSNIVKTVDNVKGSIPDKYAGSDSAGGVATSASKLSTARNIDGIPFDGSANINHYCQCRSSASTVAKTASKSGFVLTQGAEVCIKFSNTNTAVAPTLNVNSTGAKPIYYNGAELTKNNAGILKSGDIISFVYDGTNWVIKGSSKKITYQDFVELDLQSTVFSGKCYVAKLDDNFCFIENGDGSSTADLVLDKAIPANSNFVFLDTRIPSDITPGRHTYVPVMFKSSNKSYQGMLFLNADTGNATLYNLSAVEIPAKSYIHFGCIYPRRID